MPERMPKNEIFAGSDANADACVGADSFKQSSREAFDEVLRLHREGAQAKDLYFLPHLSFALDETRDPLGVRFVLWQPVALFLQYGFHVEIIEHMCGGHVVLANLEHAAAAIAEKIIPLIEATRRKEPLWMMSSGPQVLLHLVKEIAGEPLLSPATAERMNRMLREFKSAVRRGDYSGLSAFRAQLSERYPQNPTFAGASSSCAQAKKLAVGLLARRHLRANKLSPGSGSHPRRTRLGAICKRRCRRRPVSF